MTTQKTRIIVSAVIAIIAVIAFAIYHYINKQDDMRMPKVEFQEQKGIETKVKVVPSTDTNVFQIKKPTEATEQ